MIFYFDFFPLPLITTVSTLVMVSGVGAVPQAAIAARATTPAKSTNALMMNLFIFLAPCVISKLEMNLDFRLFILRKVILGLNLTSFENSE
jgi:hypothetical protein